MALRNISSITPFTFTLCADARLTEVDYCNDQIWELTFRGGDPPAIALNTSYGLRAQSMRIFPRFTEGDISRSDPARFSSPPTIQHVFPNHLALACEPFPKITVFLDYFAQDSQVIVGRIRILNRDSIKREIILDWVTLLTPQEGGQSMAPDVLESVTVMCGATADLTPLVFMTGGPKSGSSPYPSLRHNINLYPGGNRQLTWVHVGRGTPSDALRVARRAAAHNWDAESAGIKLKNTEMLEVNTGVAGWDIAFDLGQIAANQLIQSPTESLPFHSFVSTRRTENGHSPIGDGTDYGYPWNGQTPLDAWYLGTQVLPTAPNLSEGFLKNFLTTEASKQNGHVDWKPGLAGQRGQLLATPILSEITWQIYRINRDQDFLLQTFDSLLRFHLRWFEKPHDKDRDGIPEWDHVLQTGFDLNPQFTGWDERSEGVDIRLIEDPTLVAFLYRECDHLIRIASLIKRQDALPILTAIRDKLIEVFDTFWNPRTMMFSQRDRDTHQKTRGVFLGKRRGPGEIELNREFKTPVRVLLQVQTKETIRRPVRAFIHGTTPSGHHRIERLTRHAFQWYSNRAMITSQQVYSQIDRIGTQGLGDDDGFSARTVQYSSPDLTQLLPVWAGIPDETQVEKIVSKTITNSERFWQRYGLPICPRSPSRKWESSDHVWLQWNTFLCHGLLRYGFREEAARLVANLLDGITQNIGTGNAFSEFLHAETGIGLGERNHLHGLPPIRLFLETLGILPISPWQIYVDGFNPFPDPVTIKYLGTTMLSKADKIEITFPDGQEVIVDDPAPKFVSADQFT